MKPPRGGRIFAGWRPERRALAGCPVSRRRTKH